MIWQLPGSLLDEYPAFVDEAVVGRGCDATFLPVIYFQVFYLGVIIDQALNQCFYGVESFEYL